MRHALRSSVSIIVAFVLISTLLIAVFAIEKLTYVVDISLRYGIFLPTLGKLYVAMLPDAADFLLPVSVTVACYVVVLRKREAREFLILSGAGAGPGYLMLTASFVATAATVSCLLLNGFVKPLASQSFRYNYAEARAKALTEGVPGGRFYDQRGDIMFVSSAPDRDDTEDGNRLRVFQFSRARLDRMVSSDCTSLRRAGSNVIADLCNTWIYLLGVDAGRPGQQTAIAEQGGTSDCRLCADTTGSLDIARVHAGPSSLAFDMNQLLGPITGQRDSALSLVELLAVTDGKFSSERNIRLAGNRILLALTCSLAVAAAFAAVAFTARKAGPLALSGALVLVVAAMVVARSGILLVGPVQQPAYFVALMLGVLGMCAASMLWAVRMLHHRLVTPMAVQG